MHGATLAYVTSVEGCAITQISLLLYVGIQRRTRRPNRFVV